MHRASRRKIRRLAALLTALALVPVLASAQGTAELEPTQPEATSSDRSMEIFAIGFDAAVVRPLGLIAMAAGAVLFVPVVMLSAPAGGMEAIDEAYDLFIEAPYQTTITRPLGKF